MSSHNQYLINSVVQSKSDIVENPVFTTMFINSENTI